jgi:hypothetical protein
VGGAVDIPFPDQHFDVAMSVTVMEDMAQPFHSAVGTRPS